MSGSGKERKQNKKMNIQFYNLEKYMDDQEREKKRAEMFEAGKALKDLFDSLIESGFTEGQAIQLVAEMVKNGGNENE